MLRKFTKFAKIAKLFFCAALYNTHMNKHSYVQYDVETSGMQLAKDEAIQVRGGLAKRVYGLVATQLLVTLGWVAGVSMHPPLQHFVVTQPSLQLAFAVSGLLILCPLSIYKHKHPHNLLLLAAFTVCQTYQLGVVAAALVQASETRLLLNGFAITAGIFLSASLYVHWTKRDLTWLEGGLGMGLFVLAFVAIAALWSTDNTLHIVLAASGVSIFAGYILYDTSLMVHRMTPDDAVEAAVQLYLDILNLFLCVLQMLQSSE